MIIEISIVVAVFIFGILSFFLIQTLLALKKTLIETRRNLYEVEQKMRAIDPLFRSISNVGEILEEKTSQLKMKQFTAKPKMEESPKDNFILDIAELFVLSASLWQKFSKRR